MRTPLWMVRPLEGSQSDLRRAHAQSFAFMSAEATVTRHGSSTTCSLDLIARSKLRNMLSEAIHTVFRISLHNTPSHAPTSRTDLETRSDGTHPLKAVSSHQSAHGGASLLRSIAVGVLLSTTTTAVNGSRGNSPNVTL